MKMWELLIKRPDLSQKNCQFFFSPFLFGKTSIMFCSEFVKNMYKCGKNVFVRGEDGNNSHSNLLPLLIFMSTQCDVRDLSCILYFDSKITLQDLHRKCSNLQKIHQSHTFRIKYLHAQKKDLTSNLYPWESENLIILSRFMKYYY